MSKFECEDGLVELGTSEVAEVDSFEFNEDTQAKEAFAMGDARPTRRYRPGLISGTMNYLWDWTDTNGQVAIVSNGTASQMKLYPNGKVEGEPMVTFGTVHFGNDAKNGSAPDWWRRTVEFSAEDKTEGTYTTS